MVYFNASYQSPLREDFGTIKHGRSSHGGGVRIFVASAGFSNISLVTGWGLQWPVVVCGDPATGGGMTGYGV